MAARWHKHHQLQEQSWWREDGGWEEDNEEEGDGGGHDDGRTCRRSLEAGATGEDAIFREAPMEARPPSSSFTVAQTSARCPICGERLPADDNASLNRHIDACLGHTTQASTMAPRPQKSSSAVAKGDKGGKRKVGAQSGGSPSSSKQRTLMSTWARANER